MRKVIKKKNGKTKLLQKEAVVLVSRTVVKDGITVSKKDDAQRIKIRPFVTETATVGIKYGATIPTADYANVKVDVFLSCPAYLEEVPEVFKNVCAVAKKWMEEQVDEITKTKEG